MATNKTPRIKPERRSGGRRVIDPRKDKTARQAPAESGNTAARERGAVRGGGQKAD